MTLSPSRRARRLLAAGALVLAPLLTLVATAIAPANESGAAAQLAVVGRSPGRWYAANLINFVGLALLVAAVVGLMLPLRTYGARFAHVGGGLALIGVVCVAVVSGLGFVEWQMVGPGADRAQMAALLDRVEGAPAVAPILLGAGLATLGLAVLGIGLWRRGAAPAWTAALLVLGALGIDLGYELTSAPLTLAGASANLVALGFLGARTWSGRLEPPPGYVAELRR